MTEATQHACMLWRRKWQPTPVFLPGESRGWRSLVGCHLWGRIEWNTIEVTQQQRQLPGGKTGSLFCRLLICDAVTDAWHVIIYPLILGAFNFFKKILLAFLFVYSWLSWSSLLPQPFSSCSEQGYFLVAERGLLTTAASLVADHGLQGMQALVVVAPHLQSTGLTGVVQTQLPRSMWDFPGPGTEAKSPTVAGGFFTQSHQGNLVFDILKICTWL